MAKKSIAGWFAPAWAQITRQKLADKAADNAPDSPRNVARRDINSNRKDTSSLQDNESIQASKPLSKNIPEETEKPLPLATQEEIITAQELASAKENLEESGLDFDLKPTAEEEFQFTKDTYGKMYVGSKKTKDLDGNQPSREIDGIASDVKYANIIDQIKEANENPVGHHFVPVDYKMLEEKYPYAQIPEDERFPYMPDNLLEDYYQSIKENSLMVELDDTDVLFGEDNALTKNTEIQEKVIGENSKPNDPVEAYALGDDVDLVIDDEFEQEEEQVKPKKKVKTTGLGPNKPDLGKLSAKHSNLFPGNDDPTPPGDGGAPLPKPFKDNNDKSSLSEKPVAGSHIPKRKDINDMVMDIEIRDGELVNTTENVVVEDLKAERDDEYIKPEDLYIPEDEVNVEGLESLSAEEEFSDQDMPIVGPAVEEDKAYTYQEATSKRGVATKDQTHTSHDHRPDEDLSNQEPIEYVEPTTSEMTGIDVDEKTAGELVSEGIESDNPLPASTLGKIVEHSNPDNKATFRDDTSQLEVKYLPDMPPEEKEEFFKAVKAKGVYEQLEKPENTSPFNKAEEPVKTTPKYIKPEYMGNHEVTAEEHTADDLDLTAEERAAFGLPEVEEVKTTAEIHNDVNELISQASLEATENAIEQPDEPEDELVAFLRENPESLEKVAEERDIMAAEEVLNSPAENVKAVAEEIEELAQDIETHSLDEPKILGEDEKEAAVQKLQESFGK